MSEENEYKEEPMPIPPPYEDTSSTVENNKPTDDQPTEEESIRIPESNAQVELRYEIPTAKVEVSEKGKGISSISIPNSDLAKLMDNEYWQTIIQIWNSHGHYLLDQNPSDEIRRVKAIIKREFENKYGRVFTEAEYLMAPAISIASGLLYKNDNLGGEDIPVQTRENSFWEQGFRGTRDDFRPIGGVLKGAGLGASSDPITAAKGAMVMAERLGYGTIASFTLPTSGISLKFSNPTNNELFSMDEHLDSEKIHLGLNTLGYFFGANGQKVISTVVNFILSKVVSSNPDITDRATLKKLIKVTDIHALAVGLANVMYPDGYPFNTPCPHCNKVHEHGLVKPIRLMWVDNTAIPKPCRQIAEKKVLNVQDIVEYQEEIERGIKNNFYVLGEDCIPALIKFRIPSLYDYEIASETWIGQVEALVNSDRSGLSPEDRKDTYDQHANLLLASQYLGYVDYIYIMDEDEMESEAYQKGRYEEIVNDGNAGRKLTDRDSILSQLNLISQDVFISESFLQALARFRESAHFYIVGAPDIPCECQLGKMTEEEITNVRRHPKLTPIDAVNLFFVLRGRRLQWGRVPIKQVKS